MRVQERAECQSLPQRYIFFRNSPTLYRFFQLLLIFFAEQVGVGTSVEHHENQFLVVLLPNEQPVRLDMAFPLPPAVTM